MLTSHDIGELFASMRTAYGNQWKHGPEAMEVWRRSLVRFTTDRIQQAAVESLSRYVDHPPNLPQFLSVIDPPKVKQLPNTYLPPPEMSRAVGIANLTLLKVLIAVGGVDKMVLKNLVELKNALIEELSGDPTKQWVSDTHSQLMALAVAR